MTELAVRKNINDVWAIKIRLISLYGTIEQADREITKQFEQINAYSFHRIDFNCCYGDNRIEKSIDQRCWYYMVKLYQLEKYMLCTEYEKLMKQIENLNFPVFNLENAEAWLESLKELVYSSVEQLIKDVYSRIIEETYRTGTGYSNRVEKKRNNNGIDKFFIITTNDYNEASWYRNRPTLTDDLEKACYIIDGKLLPEMTIKESLRREERWEGENEYFKVLFCKNGNTHYWIKDGMRNKLNYFGANRGVISDGVKIKIFEK